MKRGFASDNFIFRERPLELQKLKKLSLESSHIKSPDRGTPWKTLAGILVALIVFGLIFGVNIATVFVGTGIALVVVLHTAIRLSAIVTPFSKIPPKPFSGYTPFVSIHIACKDEPAELVNATVAAITKLNYPAFEVIVINNNNEDVENWQKIKLFTESCGDNYIFVHTDFMPGYKAGALNYIATHNTSKDAEVVAIVDCDYIVTPDFLTMTVGYFKNPEVGIVQAPQSYYNVNSRNVGLSYEYRSFFAAVMHQAQRHNLVIFTGTMGLIRTELMRNGLKWNEWCITEDAEAGVHILSKGYKGIYVDESLGKGLMPLDYASLIKQRQRWTYGNMQVLKKDLFPVILNKALSLKQKFAFLALLVSWFHFELLVAGTYLLINMLRLVGLSNVLLTMSNIMLALLAVSLISNIVYFVIGLRKDATLSERLKAFLAHYGLLYVMSSSWVICLLGRKLGFIVTSKVKQGDRIPFSQYSHEFTIILVLLFGLGVAFLAGGTLWFDLMVIVPFVVIETAGIMYLSRSFIEPDAETIDQ